ncbi:P-loop containing nucleoside triphosphate hydrolase protein [Aaosphaeria arxii CBS 175.79]|uniref:P-loop containing nucleoside triphosphate hydrolase protein n=1 Tax=Aaosphaeria arxii CBS 175.79 TaxID=1450172 RepID=A0A6A5Y1L0_9PLEO|nr:P-loop containing nucleoside triphosphate hydrolase protein [Aaosphaeria arxii CBS 175.79]KAF2019368.1 P-loop containing nucleoside triphosphate hydrolase protein [Aaosphaeria arxii CBS 175.79]
MAPAMASQDTPMLSSSSSHRLPTISASQALQTLQTRGALAVSTGLAQLNKILSPRSLPGRDIHGGLPRGKVAEVYGPSGVGKTALGIQAAVNALREGQQVVWIDAGAPLVPQRFNDVLFADEQVQRSQNLGGTDASPPEVQLDELRSHFHHCTSPSLAHLLALFVRTPSSFPPPNTSLIVIDSLSTLLDNAYPRNPDDRAARPKNDQARWAAGRKFPVMNELISALCRVAALHDIALLFTCQTITRIRAGSRALLVPSISGAEWESGISTRLVLFRDWVPGQGKWCDADAERLRRARFVGVIKANGVTLADEGSVGDVVPFAIERGLLDLAVSTIDITTTATSPQQRLPKRRFAEIGDSEDDEPDSEELYGWVEDDEVAAEGLLIVNDTPVVNDPADAASPAASRTDHVPEREKKRVAQFERTATV